MKIILGTVAVFALILPGCKKKEDSVSETVKVVYPRITLIGDQYVTINIGESFTDPGAKMYDTFTGQETNINPTQSGVDNTTPGMYPIIYEGTNKYGFKSQAVRWVAVTSVSAGEDISGLYLRTANNSPNNVTKVSRGIYRCDNIGGVNGIPDYIYNLYFVQLSDTTLNFPAQPGPFGTTRTDTEKLVKSGSDTTLSWIVRGPGFATNVRTFSHQ